jgi:hypothetical protein
MTRQNHITLLGILHITRGVLILLIGLIIFAILAGAGALSEDETAIGVLGIIGMVVLFIMFVLAVPSIIAGIGVLLKREWGRITALVVGILSLVDVPFGTALGVYSIWLLLDDEARTLFQPAAMPAQPNPVPPSPIQP